VWGNSKPGVDNYSRSGTQDQGAAGRLVFRDSGNSQIHAISQLFGHAKSVQANTSHGYLYSSLKIHTGIWPNMLPQKGSTAHSTTCPSACKTPFSFQLLLCLPDGPHDIAVNAFPIVAAVNDDACASP